MPTEIEQLPMGAQAREEGMPTFRHGGMELIYDSTNLTQHR